MNNILVDKVNFRSKSEIKLKYLGQAGFFIMYDQISILCDPWFSEKGTFLNQWYPCLSNSHLIKNSNLLQPDFIWISHEHGDHYDPEFLCKVDKNASVVIGDFPSNRLYKSLMKLGFKKIIKLSSFEKYDLSNELKIMMILETPNISEHSSILFQDTQGFTCLLNSDTTLIDEDINRLNKVLKGPLTIFASQYINPTPYPHVANLGPKEKKIVNKDNQDGIINNFNNICRALNVQYSIPYAGPALIINRDFNHNIDEDYYLRELDIKTNYESIVKNNISNHVIMLKPGDKIKLNKQNISYPKTRKDMGRTPYKIFENMYNTYLQLDEDIPEIKIEDIYNRHSLIFNEIQKKYKILFDDIRNIFVVELCDDDYKIISKFDNGNFASSLVKNTNNYNNDNFDYKIKLRKHIWFQFVNQNISYDEINFSRRFRIEQKNNGFSYKLIRLLKSLHSFKLLKEHEKIILKEKANETIPINFEGKTYNIKKYCPHLFSSLENQNPNKEGIIKCSAHGWMFNLKNGACIKGDLNTTIKA
jgi:nitrite reductase/ring-hydroxylating ferredoxin subunit